MPNNRGIHTSTRVESTTIVHMKKRDFSADFIISWEGGNTKYVSLFGG